MSDKLTAQETKEMLLATGKEMLTSGLVHGTAGNLAARLPDGNAVLTPSSLDYLDMTLDDLVVCDLDGNVLEGERSPTTEKALHLSALRL
ncbi:MAG TPA: class II aldolase/adducin family protein, partial [Acidimicrobiia bacterium]|nr:class II aldolase/adducin family protein [Acidimicrobiia bacterium]